MPADLRALSTPVSPQKVSNLISVHSGASTQRLEPSGTDLQGHRRLSLWK